MLFDGKKINVKIDNLAFFKMRIKEVSFVDLFITPKSDIERFCQAWSCVLDVDYDGNQRAFLERFGKKINDVEINGEVITALERDGYIEPDTDVKKKDAKRLKKR